MKINFLKANLGFNIGCSSDKISKRIADAILEVRRPFKNENYSESEKRVLKERIAGQVYASVKDNKAIPITIVGFSMKCPAPGKCISQDADMAEFSALKTLKHLTDKVSEIYTKGCQLNIFADGRLFVNTIVGSKDELVTKYNLKLKKFLNILEADKIKLITPEDYCSGSPDEIRSKMFSRFPTDIENLKKRIALDPFLSVYKTFIRDFYAKDIRAIEPKKSIRQSKREAENVALGVIAAADSLDRYIYTVIPPGSLRVSVHAKPVNDLYNKVGIFLNELKSNCPMPWHGAAVKIPQEDNSAKFIYEKKSILEKFGCELVSDNIDIGPYFVLPKKFNYDKTLSLKENFIKNRIA